MARTAASSSTTDNWMKGFFGAVVCALISGGLMSPAVFTQTQSVDVVAVFAGLAGLIGVLSVLGAGRVALPRTRLGVAWAAFLAWALIAAMVSGRGMAAFMGVPTSLSGWLTLAAMASIALATSLRAGFARELLEIAAPWLLAMEVAFVAFAFWRASGQPMIVDLVGRGTLPNSTGLGEATLLLLPWALTEAPGPRRLRMPVAGRVAVVAASIGVLMLGQSRVALVVALLWLGWVGLGRTQLSQRKKNLVTAGAILAVTIAGSIYAAGQMGQPGGGQLGLRPEFARAVVRAVSGSPLVGFGPDGFIAGGAIVSTLDSVGSTGPLVFAPGSTDPHNMLLLIAVSTGLVGLALFVWALAEIPLAWRTAARGGTSVGPGAWAVAGALAVFLTAPASLAVLPMFAFVLGATLPAPAGERTGGTSRTLGFVALGVLGVAGLVLAANALTRLPLERPGAQDSPGLARIAQQSAATWVVDPYLWHLASMHLGWAASSDPTVLAARADLAAAERAAAIDTHDPFVALELARTRRFYQLPDAEVEAAFADTFRRWPVYPLAHAEFAGFLASVGRTEEAIRQLELVENLNANDPQAAAVARDVRAELGK